MNRYWNLLSPRANATGPGQDEGFRRAYGNRVANARARREAWEPAHEAISRALAAADPRAALATPAACAGACSG